ncbi:MAG: hypothetical protein ABIS86_23955 [Streptosporangiaceae bacterium]
MFPRSARLGPALVIVLGTTLLAGCTGESADPHAPPAPVSDTPAATSPPTPAEPPPALDPKSAAPPSADSTRRTGCPPVPAYPTPACTGVPDGVRLTVHQGDWEIKEAGTRVRGVHVTGRLLIAAPGITIVDSQIDGFVTNFSSGPVQHQYSITDSTVGAVGADCNLETGVGGAHYTATRVEIVAHGDGFGDAGDDVRVQDSYVLLCAKTDAHSDGIQGFRGGRNVVVKHNTFDQRQAPRDGITAPVFISDGSKDATVVDNLLAGGSETLRVYDGGGQQIVTGNRIVDKAWVFGPVSASCATIEKWADNRLVEIDKNYVVTSVGAVLPCVA